MREGTIVLRLPVGLPTVEEERTIDRLVRRVTGAERAARRGGDAALRRRADLLADHYLDGVRASSVAWSQRMEQRLGSCTIDDGSIRISARLAGAPDYVLDAILVHELAHLQVADHSAAFAALVARYPEHARAEGYLEGFRAGWLAARTPQAPPDIGH